MYKVCAPTKMKNLWKTKHLTFRNLAFKTAQTNIRILTIAEVNTWWAIIKIPLVLNYINVDMLFN